MSSLYWMWEKELTPEKCQDIIDRAGSDFEKAKINTEEGSGSVSRVNNKTRKTNIHWNNDQDLYDMAFHYMRGANKKSGWNLQVDAAESFQIGQYSTGGHYNWHVDGLGSETLDEPNNKLLNGKTRKISMVVWLNEDFKGGDFQFHSSHLKNNVFKVKQGSIIMFPSWVMHRVTPVKEGTRYSMVSWFLGKPIQ